MPMDLMREESLSADNDPGSPARPLVGRRERMRFPALPFGVLPLTIAGLLIFAFVRNGTAAMWHWEYQEWAGTSSQFVWQLALAGPLAASAATYLAGRVTSPSRIFALRSASRSAPGILARHLGLLLTSMLGGYLLALVPILALTARDAEQGGPDIPVLATGLLGLSAYVLFGYLVGLAGRSSVLAPLTFAITLGFTIAGTTQTNPLSPVPQNPLFLGQEASRPLTWFRLLFLAFALLVMVQFCLDLLRQTSRKPSPATVMLLPVLLVMVALPMVSTPAISRYDANAPRVCKVAGGVQYCVHAGHRSQLPEFVRSGHRVVTAYGFVPTRVARVYDQALLGTVNNPQGIVWAGLSPEVSTSEGVAVNMSATLVSLDTCRRRQPQPSAIVISWYERLSFWLVQEGAERPNTRNPLPRMSRSEAHQWLKDHDRQIETCSITVNDLPR